ncbi:MAG: hypothetical protein IKU61_06440 [Clostridia bacterium]|nr:hypothetical protein [Clostridia bacterium]
MARKVIISNRQDGEQSSSYNGESDMSVKQAHIVAEGYVKEVQRARKYNEDASYELGEIEKLVKNITDQEFPAGEPMAFHNFSVTLATIELYKLACDVLDKGLAIFPMSVDLLADYLIYGIDCGRYSECEKRYETLCMIDKSEWTWRAFSFSIAYIKRLRERTADAATRAEYKNTVETLAKEYKENLPYREDGYRQYAELFSADPDRELSLLCEVLENEKIGACPASAFRYADILFEQKKYYQALLAVKRSREDAKAQMQGGINEHYLSFLSALCKIAIAEGEGRKLNADEVNDIYSDFEIALYGLTGDFRKTVRTRVQFLQKETKVQVGDEYENILELLGY